MQELNAISTGNINSANYSSGVIRVEQWSGEVTARNQVIHVDKTEINIFGPGVTT